MTLRALAALLTLALAAVPAGPAVAAEAEAQARGVVDRTLESVLGVLRNEDVAEAAKRSKVEEIAYANFDFDTMSKLVLARNWKKLSGAQRDAFLVEFKRHLSLTYGDTLLDYKDQEVKIASTRLENNGDVTVRTEIHGVAAQPYKVDYRLREQADGSWRVIDVVIESVSLISNFRSQTQEILSDVGPDRLIERLREKNAERAEES